MLDFSEIHPFYFMKSESRLICSFLFSIFIASCCVSVTSFKILLAFRFSNNSSFPTSTAQHPTPCRPENFWIWIQKNPSFYCPPWELDLQRLRIFGGVYVYCIREGWLLGCLVAACCLWSFDCWCWSCFLCLFLSLFLLLLWWWCFLFARNTFFSSLIYWHL